jgi:hypothetical protein
LGSRAPKVLKVAGLAVEVKDRTGAGNPAVPADPVHGEHLSLDVRLKPHDKVVAVRLYRAPQIHFPDPERLSSSVFGRGRDSTAGGANQDQQWNDSHGRRIRFAGHKNKSR